MDYCIWAGLKLTIRLLNFRLGAVSGNKLWQPLCKGSSAASSLSLASPLITTKSTWSSISSWLSAVADAEAEADVAANGVWTMPASLPLRLQSSLSSQMSTPWLMGDRIVDFGGGSWPLVWLVRWWVVDVVVVDVEDDHEDELFCTVWVRITCMAPLAVRAFSTSNCLRCVCCVPFGCEMFWESDIWGESGERERGIQWWQDNEWMFKGEYIMELI